MFINVYLSILDSVWKRKFFMGFFNFFIFNIYTFCIIVYEYGLESNETNIFFFFIVW